MRMLFLCFVVVLFISDNAANPIDSVDIVEASGEKENLTSDDNSKSAEKSVENPVDRSVSEQLNSENEMPGEVIRSKKSNYPSAPYSNAPYPSASYPSAPYSSAPYPGVPYPSAPYPSTCGCSNQYAQQSVSYSAPQISYGAPSYNGYPGSFPGYGPPQYSRPKSGGRKKNSYWKQSSYQSGQPSYQAEALYQSSQPSYQSPQPSYQSPQPSYQSPQPSYQSPEGSYQSTQPSYQPSQAAYHVGQSAPVYPGSSSSYRSSSYDNQAYVAPGPSQTYSYPSAAPKVQCGSNVLVGCQPHVSEVPCSGYSPSYGSSNYAQPQQYSAPGYRSADEATLSTSPTHEKTSDTADNHNTKSSGAKDDASISSILSAPTIHAIDKGTHSEKNKNDAQLKDATVSTTNELNPDEDAKQKKFDTLMKMSEMAKTLAKDEKGISQQNHLTPTNPHKINEKIPYEQPPYEKSPYEQPPYEKSPYEKSPYEKSPYDKPLLPVPPPTSVNVGMNAGPSNQVNPQFMPQQRPNPWV